MNLNRRSFFKLLGIGAGAAVATKLNIKATPPPPPIAPPASSLPLTRAQEVEIIRYYARMFGPVYA